MSVKKTKRNKEAVVGVADMDRTVVTHHRLEKKGNWVLLQENRGQVSHIFVSRSVGLSPVKKIGCPIL